MKYFHQTKAFLNAREEVKTIAKSIRELKAELRSAQRNGEYTGSIRQLLGMAQYRFRHKNIALALVKGKTREQIERPSEKNSPNEATIKSYYDALVQAINKELEQEEVSDEASLRLSA